MVSEMSVCQAGGSGDTALVRRDYTLYLIAIRPTARRPQGRFAVVTIPRALPALPLPQVD